MGVQNTIGFTKKQFKSMKQLALRDMFKKIIECSGDKSNSGSHNSTSITI
jgi:hypothetical protein